MKTIKITMLLALLALPLYVHAEPEAPAPTAPAASAALDTNNDGVVDAKEMAAATNADADVGDVVADSADAAKVIGKLVGDKDPAMPVGTMVLLILGVVFKLLLSSIKLVGKNVAWFKTKDGKRVIKYSTLGLGAAAGLVANLAFGMSWLEAAQIVLSGPLAVAIHEYTSDSKDTPPEPDNA